MICNPSNSSIMKKTYNTPLLSVISFDTADIITSSPLGTSEKTSDGSKMYSPRHNAIWDEDE